MEEGSHGVETEAVEKFGPDGQPLTDVGDLTSEQISSLIKRAQAMSVMSRVKSRKLLRFAPPDRNILPPPEMDPLPPRLLGTTPFTTQAEPPEPERGGTFFYCPWAEDRTEHGRVTHWACGVLKPGWATGTRFRTEAAYRRHWRRQHA
jgi:hypothetical protein